jgi:hypothetical protein
MGVTLGLSLREKRKLRVFDNRVLRKIFGLRGTRQEGEWRRLHNEEFYDLNSSPNIIRMIKPRRMRKAELAAPTGERRDAYRGLIEERVGKRPLRRIRRM